MGTQNLQPAKTILILGGASDIGQAIAAKFADEGFRVLLAGRDREYLSRIAKDISIRKNAVTDALEFEATHFSAHKDFYHSLEKKPDVCVCVFGYLGEQTVAEKDWNEAEKIIDANYKGAVSILNVVAADFAERREGTIIGISSVAGDRGRQSNFIYGSAKAGFTTYLSGLRNRLYNKRVHVITVKPGFVDTKMTEGLNLPPRLTASPQQVADAVFDAYRKKRDTIYVLPLWRYVMLVIRLIPESVFKRLKL